MDYKKLAKITDAVGGKALKRSQFIRALPNKEKGINYS